MRAVSTPHNHLRFSMRGLSFWHPTLCPDEDDSAAGIAPLIQRRGTEEVRVDFDRENLRRYERDRGGLDRWKRVVYAVDEVGRRTVVRQRRVQDLPLSALDLDRQTGPLGRNRTPG